MGLILQQQPYPQSTEIAFGRTITTKILDVLSQ